MGNLTTRGLRHSDGSDLFRGFHHGKSRTLVIRIPDSIPPKWVILRHVASVIRTASRHQDSRFRDSRFPEMGNLTTRGLRHSDGQIYSGAFTPIHWGLNPRVTPDRSNGCRVFQPRSDGSDWFLPVHSSTTPWTWKNQRSRYSHGPWRSTVPNSSLSTKTQKTKG
jgi:hypothetical protein